MNIVFDKLSELARDAFTCLEVESDPFPELVAAGIEPAQAAVLLADLKSRAIPKANEQWQSCDACWDPGSDRDRFDDDPNNPDT